jgi:hypothetical protein
MSLLKDYLTHEDGRLNLAGKQFLQNLYNLDHQIELGKARLTAPWTEAWEIPIKKVQPWQ